jgi:2-aminoethylphosphonate-pyruvate transaminase
MRLLNPGPVTLTERVRRSMLAPDLCHRESEFFDLQDEARVRRPPATNACTACRESRS